MARRWSDREIEVLEAMLDEGHSSEAIAHRLGRTIASIECKSADIRRPLQPGRKPARGWSKEDDCILQEMAAAGRTAAAIGEALGRSRNSVIGRSHRLNVYLSAKGGPRPGQPRPAPPPRVTVAERPFSDDERAKIMRLVAMGEKHRAVAAALGRSTSDVREFVTEEMNRRAREADNRPAPHEGQSAPEMSKTAPPVCEGAEDADAAVRADMRLPGRGCQWIEGDPMAGDGCKCMAPVRPGSVYCPAHHARCYTAPPPRKRRSRFTWAKTGYPDRAA